MNSASESQMIHLYREIMGVTESQAFCMIIFFDLVVDRQARSTAS